MPFKKITIACITLIALAAPSHAQNQKIISLAPAITQMIYDLNAQDQLIGVSTFSPIKNHNKAIISDAFSLNLEHILTLQPTLILGIQDFTNQKHIAQLQSLQLPIKLIEASHSWEHIQRMFRSVANITKTKTRAEKIISQCNNTIQYISNQHSQKIPERVFVQIGIKPLMTIGSNSYLNSLMQNLNLKPIFQQEARNTFTVALEHVLTKQPEWVIDLSYFGHRKDILKFWKTYQQSLPQDHILIFNDVHFTLPTPYAYVQSLKTLHKALIQ